MFESMISNWLGYTVWGEVVKQILIHLFKVTMSSRNNDKTTGINFKLTISICPN